MKNTRAAASCDCATPTCDWITALSRSSDLPPADVLLCANSTNASSVARAMPSAIAGKLDPNNWWIVKE